MPLPLTPIIVPPFTINAPSVSKALSAPVACASTVIVPPLMNNEPFESIPSASATILILPPLI